MIKAPVYINRTDDTMRIHLSEQINWIEIEKNQSNVMDGKRK